MYLVVGCEMKRNYLAALWPKEVKFDAGQISATTI